MHGSAARLVRALKYGRWEALARPMGLEMVACAHRLAAEEAAMPELVPVPLSAARLRERGFNQAERIAESLAAATGSRVAPLLERRRSARRQARLGSRGRHVNVLGLFHAVETAATRRVLIVDDVVTTGATATACARALRQAGSVPVGVVSFARALYGDEVP